jgi:DNA-binding XRE family transcriptional regulator
MQSKPTPKPNQLDIFRKKMKLNQHYVAHLLGHKDTSAWSDYERGDRLPSLVNALRLGIILRTPVEFLFYALHDDLRNQIRAEEERMVLEPAKRTQQVLF